MPPVAPPAQIDVSEATINSVSTSTPSTASTVPPERSLSKGVPMANSEDNAGVASAVENILISVVGNICQNIDKNGQDQQSGVRRSPKQSPLPTTLHQSNSFKMINSLEQKKPTLGQIRKHSLDSHPSELSSLQVENAKYCGGVPETVADIMASADEHVKEVQGTAAPALSSSPQVVSSSTVEFPGRADCELSVVEERDFFEAETMNDPPPRPETPQHPTTVNSAAAGEASLPLKANSEPTQGETPPQAQSFVNSAPTVGSPTPAQEASESLVAVSNPQQADEILGVAQLSEQNSVPASNTSEPVAATRDNESTNAAYPSPASPSFTAGSMDMRALVQELRSLREHVKSLESEQQKMQSRQQELVKENMQLRQDLAETRRSVSPPSRLGQARSSSSAHSTSLTRGRKTPARPSPAPAAAVSMPSIRRTPSVVGGALEKLPGSWYSKPLQDAFDEGLFFSCRDVKVYIEHCDDCRQHASTTRHLPENYEGRAHDIEQEIEDRIIQSEVQVLMNLDAHGKHFRARLGSFEVVLTWRDGKNNALHKILLFTKLQSMRFPNASALTKRLSAVLPAEEGILAILCQDACTGAALGGVKMSINAPGKDEVVIRSGEQGCAVINLTKVMYHVSIAHGDYLPSSLDVAPSDIQRTVPMPLVPRMDENQLRVVLSWGAAPEDLDLHVFTSEFEVDFDRRDCEDGTLLLENDARTGFGPETALITYPLPSDMHIFVHHYDGAGSLSMSGAIVKVYNSEGLEAAFEVPQDDEGSDCKFWYVGARRPDGSWHLLDQPLQKSQPEFVF